MEQANILVIEDDDIVSRTIERCLRRENYKVALASSGVEGLQLAHKRIPELVILDVIMPGMDGYTVCREMRADPLLVNVPILFLTAKTKDEDKITGFNAGADDYLGKPFNLDELILRVKAIIRRTKSVKKELEAESSNKPFSLSNMFSKNKNVKDIKTEQQPLVPLHCILVQGYVLDTKTYELTIPGNTKIRLTPIQYDLLYHLMSHPGEIFSPNRLLDEVWDYPSDTGSPDLVRVHIKNLRERVELDPHLPSFIETVPGYGYTIKAERS
jgi:two-component system alkaline phosphatase synthesis response regulator PhoP/two-component system response regulator RpaA